MAGVNRDCLWCAITITATVSITGPVGTADDATKTIARAVGKAL